MTYCTEHPEACTFLKTKKIQEQRREWDKKEDKIFLLEYE